MRSHYDFTRGKKNPYTKRLSNRDNTVRKPEPTPVDDVRRVRERLSEEAGNDVRKLAEQAQRKAEEYRRKLHLKSAGPKPGRA